MINSKRVLIFGFGKEGVSAANFLGKDNEITFFDDRLENEIDREIKNRLKTKAKIYYGGDYPLFTKFDLLVRSPGVRSEHEKIKFYLKKGAKLTTPTNIFFENCPAKIIAVTGTKGKGTTSSLIFKILSRAGLDIHLAGNIGTPMLNILPNLTKKSIVILELSSFQLIDLKYSPHIAVVLMITQEHLDWHKNKDEYLTSKQSIVKYQSQSDYAVINADFLNSLNLPKLAKSKKIFFSTKQKTNGVYIKGNEIISNEDGKIMSSSQVLLKGAHNLQNICAAITTAKILKVVNADIVEAVKAFQGLKHRLQLVKEVKGVNYINDSYSTIPDTSIAAIKAFGEPKILILGGSSKKADFKLLAQEINSNKSVKAVILIGQESAKIKKAIKPNGQSSKKLIENLTNMDQIVKNASALAKRGDVVILSPACASFDMFKNYEDRGQQFLKAVAKLQ